MADSPSSDPKSDEGELPASLAPFVSETALSRRRFRFDDVSVVVMDEFHQFSDPERGIVWEFTLGLLPPQQRRFLLFLQVGIKDTTRPSACQCRGRGQNREVRYAVPRRYVPVSERNDQSNAPAYGLWPHGDWPVGIKNGD